MLICIEGIKCRRLSLVFVANFSTRLRAGSRREAWRTLTSFPTPRCPEINIKTWFINQFMQNIVYLITCSNLSLKRLYKVEIFTQNACFSFRLELLQPFCHLGSQQPVQKKGLSLHALRICVCRGFFNFPNLSSWATTFPRGV
jgi:hypothetical protein